jgi:recombination protein RecR
MQPFEHLQKLFMRLPGIGRRQARRLVFFLLQQDSRFRKELATTIQNIDANMHLCQNSFQYFYSENQSETLSPIERDASRDRSQIMIVEKDMDLEAIEQSNVYKGTYFVIGGLIPMIKHDVSHLRIDPLLQHIEKRAAQGLAEIIMSFSYNPESEHTRMFLEEKLKPVVEKHNLTISKLGRGLSTGTELEYSDSDTLRHALSSRF